MPRPRAIFRIEELGAAPAAVDTSSNTGTTLRHDELMVELRSLREAVRSRSDQNRTSLFEEAAAMKGKFGWIHDAVQRTRQEIASLLVTGVASPDVLRVSQELNAVVGGTESATHRILEACEQIEEAAHTLAAAIKNVQDQNLARDILDQVTHIFEACNFQDLAGQRINKVTNTLKFIEDHILELTQIWGGIEELADVHAEAKADFEKNAPLLNGPKLDDDVGGFVSQREIDAMFAVRN